MTGPVRGNRTAIALEVREAIAAHRQGKPMAHPVGRSPIKQRCYGCGDVQPHHGRLYCWWCARPLWWG